MPCRRGTGRAPRLRARGLAFNVVDPARELSEFLTSRRAKVSPEQAGLRSYGRRQVPGLRREEVASIAGVSVEYYGSNVATRPGSQNPSWTGWPRHSSSMTRSARICSISLAR